MKPTTLAIAAAALLSLCLAPAVARAEVKTEEIEYEHDGVTLLGYLAYDDAVEGKRPGVLVVHEWWGHNEYARQRAEQLAELGYVAFALDMYGKGVRAKDPKEAGKMAGAFRADRQLMRDRAAAGLAVLQGHELVDADRCASIGYCFGGTVSLELARSGANVAGVVSFHGGLGTPNPKDAANIKGKVLVCHGSADTFISDEELVAFRQEMHDAGVDWEMNVYGGAVHSFTNPAADKAGIPGVAYDERADRRSWEDMKDFFDEIFGSDNGGATKDSAKADAKAGAKAGTSAGKKKSSK